MNITLNYFAWLRERVGMGSEQVELPADVKTIDDLFEWFDKRDEQFSPISENRELIQVAIDQQHVQDRKSPIGKAKEIALFPPMTGG